ncbi:MAG: hypothetical protein JNK85_24725, partial [Verrucomicrobiales bacterium]|nr:hypothetical protein [Verrucomicrobiales bacterium]
EFEFRALPGILTSARWPIELTVDEIGRTGLDTTVGPRFELSVASRQVRSVRLSPIRSTDVPTGSLLVAGEPEHRIRLEVSTNLETWIGSVVLRIGLSGEERVELPTHSESTPRFYRAVVLDP